MITELDMFNYIKQRYVPDLEKSNQYDSWDCVSSMSRMYLELKARSSHYEDLLIEKAKYDLLRMTAIRKSYIAWYINATPEGIWAFNLSKLPSPEWVIKELPSTTEFADTSKRNKQIGYLRVSDGIKM